LMLIVSFARRSEKMFTASTPANALVRTFLGIALDDSVDFIRWKLALQDNSYHLECHYGIGKPNTNGFFDGGKKIELNGPLKKRGVYYQFQNGEKSLNVARLNENLLQIADNNNTLLVGNGGWSYTLNTLSPVITDAFNLQTGPLLVKDSVRFTGRSGCKVPGVIASGSRCYKLKWLIAFYVGPGKAESGDYKIYGTAFQKEGGKRGNWKMMRGKNGRIIYQLYDEDGKSLLYLLKVTDGVLLFTDKEGNLLVGDEDFSYTLNKVANTNLKM
jgi:hypothetical protein